MKPMPGADAVKEKGWWKSHQWLLLRRSSQIGILLLFLAGPWADIWVVKGNLNSSLTLDILPLTDPYVALQSLLAGQSLMADVVIGAVVVAGFYILIGGRSYCSWVCPVNIITDLSEWLRRQLGLSSSVSLRSSLRYWLLAATFIVAVASGVIAWELVNPVSMLHRGVIFGMGFAWTIVLAVFLFDLVVSRRGWCGHLCPVGAFYSLLASYSPLRISASRRNACNDCLDCFAVCPEPKVISPALKGVEKNIGPVILSPQCTNCGRCIDVCSKKVFQFSSRFNNQMEAMP
ncbi:MAG: quinol dehydrogenase ferredoxin subunit NapH [Gammaproteobacteria bacterium]|nr:quinol dehydrogenase ferredoxin subunit NapH [Gammaproteobacteria bacterium]